jgi:tRNA pseudouridine38-40 synthase
MPTFRLTVEYDGTDFVGWQSQASGRSVQGEIEKAIKQILQTDVRIVGAGRTDAGVHARGQVASFTFAKALELRSFAKSLNAVLPEDVVIRDVEETAPDFNARFSAKGRRYIYYVSTEPVAVQRRYCWRVFYTLDTDLMQHSARAVHGEHDFSAFCKAESEVKNHRCIVREARWIRNNGLMKFDITANRFLHGMVRALVGTMVNVGRGYTSLGEFTNIVESHCRSEAGSSAPAKGLFLQEILYEG